MKEVKAIIQPFKAREVIEALAALGGDLPGVTVSEVQGFGKGRLRHAPEKIVEGGVAYVERTKLEIMVRDDQVDAVVNCIEQHAHTGNTGDGKIWVIPIEQTVKIRTGERGEAAI
jgi:nitrogen regulatory protein P-II 1